MNKQSWVSWADHQKLQQELAEAHHLLGEQGLELVSRAEDVTQAWNVARVCWRAWVSNCIPRPGSAPDRSQARDLSDRFPQLREPLEQTLMDLLAEDLDG